MFSTLPISKKLILSAVLLSISFGYLYTFGAGTTTPQNNVSQLIYTSGRDPQTGELTQIKSGHLNIKQNGLQQEMLTVAGQSQIISTEVHDYIEKVLLVSDYPFVINGKATIGNNVSPESIGNLLIRDNLTVNDSGNITDATTCQPGNEFGNCNSPANIQIYPVLDGPGTEVAFLCASDNGTLIRCPAEGEPVPEWAQGEAQGNVNLPGGGGGNNPLPFNVSVQLLDTGTACYTEQVQLNFANGPANANRAVNIAWQGTGGNVNGDVSSPFAVTLPVGTNNYHVTLVRDSGLNKTYNINVTATEGNNSQSDSETVLVESIATINQNHIPPCAI